MHAVQTDAVSLDLGLTVVFACTEAADLGNQPLHFALFRDFSSQLIPGLNARGARFSRNLERLDAAAAADADGRLWHVQACGRRSPSF
jgi:hypothetical protein